jgi:AbrB family transcriptional regulator, transcriptional pleiotropic regulator of transition state genes
MKNTGVVRRLDELGRITLPIELRRTIGAEDREPFEIYTDEDAIILKKYVPDVPVCATCGETKSLLNIGKKHICRDCAVIAHTALLKE